MRTEHPFPVMELLTQPPEFINRACAQCVEVLDCKTFQARIEPPAPLAPRCMVLFNHTKHFDANIGIGYPRTMGIPIYSGRAVIIDGTNVALQCPSGPSLRLVISVFTHLLHNGALDCSVFWDASARHKFIGDELATYSQFIQDYPDHFVQCPAKRAADTSILSQAEKINAVIVSNDQFLKYYNSYLWLRDDPTRLIRILWFRGAAELSESDQKPESFPIHSDLKAAVSSLKKALSNKSKATSSKSSLPPIRPKARQRKGAADIVFCIDATSSMSPCFEGLRNYLNDFTKGLQSAGQVDCRLRLIAYRDLHDPSSSATPWEIFPFTEDDNEFRSQLARIKPLGGGDAPESTLDAIYMATQSAWRTQKTHKTILLFTDADTHQTLHKSTYPHSDNGVSKVIQELQTLNHCLLFMKVPRYPIYEQIDKSMKSADCKMLADYLPPNTVHQGLKSVDWSQLLNMIGKIVSSTSVAVAGTE